MMKRGLQPVSGSVGLLTCQPCCTDGDSTINNPSSLTHLLPSNQSVPDLVDQCEASISSSGSDTSSLLSSDDEFEISNFGNFEISDRPVTSSYHNSKSHTNSMMESDCKELKSLFVTSCNGGTSSQDTIMNMLALLSDRMMTLIQDMQHQLIQTELKFSTALEKISEDNEKFKRDLREELQQLHLTPVDSSNLLNSTTNNLTTSSSVLPSSSLLAVLPVTNVALDSQDFQNQMMSLLTATVSKLTNIVGETKSTESKSDWSKFGGEIKKFKHWYLAIVVQLSLAPWKEFYDTDTNTLLKITTKTSLNEKLYAKLLLSLEDQVFQDMVSKKTSLWRWPSYVNGTISDLPA
jgi:nucleoid DNA-binding protein